MTTNRFIGPLRVFVALLVLQYFVYPINTYAQSGFFNFNYPGPDTAHVNADCWRKISDIMAQYPPVVSSTVGANITMSMFDGTYAPFYGFNDLVPPGSNPVVIKWLVKDDQNHMHVFEFPIRFLDATKPAFDLTNHPPVLNLNSVVQLPAVVNPPVIDNCPPPPNITVTFNESSPLPDTCQSGVVTRTWTATDGGGNTAIFTQTINIFKDTLPPVIATFPQNGSAPCAQLATAYPNWLATQMANFKATDPSGIKAYTNNAPPNYPTGCVNAVTVTFKAIDNCDIMFPTTAVFSTSDTRPPTVVKSARDTVAFCATTPNAFLPHLGNWINKRAATQAFDTCSPSNLLQYRMRIGGIQVDSGQVVSALQASLSGNCNTQIIGGKTYDRVRGSVKVEFLVKDACNNEASMGEATFIVRDTLPPIITGKDTTHECGGGDDQAALQAWINANANASFSDDCSTATWTNFSWTTSTGVSGNGTFVSGPFPVVHADNCSWNVSVTFRATDQCGNIGAKTLKFSLTDKTKPVFPPLATIKVYCPQVEPANPTAKATDNCDSLLTYSFAKQRINGSCTGNYDVKVTFTATDDCGNSATAEQIYQIRDTLPPSFTTIPGTKTFYCDTFVLPDTVKLGIDIFATDLCSPVVAVKTTVNSGQNPNPALCSHYQYNITRIFTARDECGNTSTSTQLLQIIDNQGPILNGWTDTTAVCDNVPIFAPPIGTDACGAPVSVATKLTEIKTIQSCVDQYTLTSSWQAKDVCNNNSPIFIREILVRDTTRPIITGGLPPDAIAECDAIPSPPNLNTFLLFDNCDTDVSISFAESEIRNPDTFACDHWANYIVRREWTVTDNCGNTRRYTQNIQIQDNTGPVLAARQPFKVPAALGSCGMNLLVPPPLSLYDVCTSVGGNVFLSDSMVLKNSSGLPNLQTGVDTVVFQWASPNLPPAVPVVGPASLKISLKNADADGPTEFLNILGENNTLLGRTKRSPNQCGASDTTIMVPADLLNAWLTDGQLHIRLAKNGATPPSNEVNVVTCPNGQPAKAFAELQYTTATQRTGIGLTYKLDNRQTANYPPSTSTYVEVGPHTILYTATDCSGNTSTATTTFIVEDLQPPILTVPGPHVYYTGVNNCESEVTLPFPNIVENCSMSGVFSQTTPPVPVEFHFVQDVGMIPKDISRAFNGLIPNAVGTGRLLIRHKGDNDNFGEYFNVLDEKNIPVGKTNSGPAIKQCKEFHETPITLTAAQINEWAKDGIASFSLVANDDSANDFINPCATLTNGFDGISEVVLVLEYSYAIVDYTLRNSAGTILEQNKPLIANETKKTLTPGNYSVEYKTSDVYGLVGIGKYNLSVRDTVRPNAFCKQAIIKTNPGGLEHIITQDSINNGSADNCTPSKDLSFSLSKTKFSCLDIPHPQSSITVTLTVTDTSGNTSTCATLVRIETEKPTPSFTPVCEGGKLQLFANPPSGAVPYSFQWSGPIGNFSFDRNPEINPATKAQHDGTYTVTVTGVPGCTAVGAVTVALIAPPNKPTLSVDSLDTSYCLGDDVVLTASGTASDAVFEWYEIDGFPKLIGTTNAVATFTVLNPTPGTHQYYVRATGNGCASQNSEIRSVTVNVPPIAVVQDDFVEVCENASFTLMPKSIISGASYQWAGPNVQANASTQNLVAGLSMDGARYLLTVIKDGCRSIPDTVLLEVKPQPAQPTFTFSQNPVCEGDDVKLVTDPLAGQFIWSKSAIVQSVTNSNFLQLDSVAIGNENATWRVAIMIDGCVSLPSNGTLLSISRNPEISPMVPFGVCSTDTIKFKPTATNTTAWEWRGPSGYQRFEKEPLRVPPVAGTYTLIATNNNLCRDMATVDVTVFPTPIATATHVAPKCLTGTQTIRLVSSVTNGTWPYTYMWTGPKGYQNNVDSVPLIASATSDNVGSYNLVVKDKNGCISQPTTTTITGQDRPVPPVLAPVTPVCTGQKVKLTVSNANDYKGDSVVFCWNTPLGIVPTKAPEYEIAALNFQFVGTYSVVVKVDSCDSETSASVDVIEKPIPPPPVVLPQKDTVICSGEPLELRVVGAQQGTIYQWSGPVSKTGESIIINAVDMTHAGTYIVFANKDGCISSASEGLKITVLEKPKVPFAIVKTGAVCLGQSRPMRLEADTASLTQGAQYQWFNAFSNAPIIAPRDSAVLETNNFSGILKPGENKFYLKALKNGCVSGQSQTVSIWADTIPNIKAYAGDDFFSCDTIPFQIKALKPSVGTGNWHLLSGSTIKIVDPIKDTTLVLNPFGGNTYLFTWTLTERACINYSTDTLKVTSSKRETAESEDLIRVCPFKGAYNINLKATQGQHVKGYWTQSLQQWNLGLVIVDSLNLTTEIKNANGGQRFFFYWNLAVPGCPLSTATTEVLTYSIKPFLGPDLRFCAESNCIAIKRDTSIKNFETGKWKSIGSNLSFIPDNAPVTTVCGLRSLPEINTIIWEINDGVCGNDSRDTMVINYGQTPVAMPDSFITAYATPLRNFNILANDIRPSSTLLTITSRPTNGKLDSVKLVAGVYNYIPNSGFSGTDEFTYSLCNTQCLPDPACATTIVKITVLPRVGCKLPTIITPNGDDVNDEFRVNCFRGEGATKPRFTVFNQWGDEVYHSDAYNNDWKGTNQQGGEELPVGTYYYIFDYNDGLPDPIVKNFLIIQR